LFVQGLAALRPAFIFFLFGRKNKENEAKERKTLNPSGAISQGATP